MPSIMWLRANYWLSANYADHMQIVFCVNAVTRPMLYSIHEARKQRFFVTVGWRKQRGRQAEQRLWHRDRWIQRERQTSAYTNRGRMTGIQMYTKSKGATQEKRKKIDWREAKESDRDVLYPIHHVVFKWLRVDAYEGGTQINQI